MTTIPTLEAILTQNFSTSGGHFELEPTTVPGLLSFSHAPLQPNQANLAAIWIEFPDSYYHLNKIQQSGDKGNFVEVGFHQLTGSGYHYFLPKSIVSKGQAYLLQDGSGRISTTLPNVAYSTLSFSQSGVSISQVIQPPSAATAQTASSVAYTVSIPLQSAGLNAFLQALLARMDFHDLIGFRSYSPVKNHQLKAIKKDKKAPLAIVDESKPNIVYMPYEKNFAPYVIQNNRLEPLGSINLETVLEKGTNFVLPESMLQLGKNAFILPSGVITYTQPQGEDYSILELSANKLRIRKPFKEIPTQTFSVNQQLIKFDLEKGDYIVSESGTKQGSSGHISSSSSYRLISLLSRLLTRESLAVDKFAVNKGTGTVTIGNNKPGRIIAVHLEPGMTLIAERGAFFAHSAGVKYGVKPILNIAHDLVSLDEGPFWQTFTGVEETYRGKHHSGGIVYLVSQTDPTFYRTPHIKNRVEVKGGSVIAYTLNSHKSFSQNLGLAWSLKNWKASVLVPTRFEYNQNSVDPALVITEGAISTEKEKKYSGWPLLRYVAASTLAFAGGAGSGFFYDVPLAAAGSTVLTIGLQQVMVRISASEHKFKESVYDLALGVLPWGIAGYMVGATGRVIYNLISPKA